MKDAYEIEVGNSCEFNKLVRSNFESKIDEIFSDCSYFKASNKFE